MDGHELTAPARNILKSLKIKTPKQVLNLEKLACDPLIL